MVIGWELWGGWVLRWEYREERNQCWSSESYEVGEFWDESIEKRGINADRVTVMRWVSSDL